MNKKFYALDGKNIRTTFKNGKKNTQPSKKWIIDVDSGVHVASATIGQDGSVFFCTLKGWTYCVDGATGKIKWKFDSYGNQKPYDLGQNGTPALSKEGVLYVSSHDSRKIFALDAKTGKKKWEFEKYQFLQGPAIGANGVVYAGCQGDFNFYAIDSRDGQLIWEYEAKSETGYISIGADGTIYGGTNKKVFALDGKTGAKKWEFVTGNMQSSSVPVIGVDGTVYIGSFDKKFYALDGQTGAKKWEFLTGQMLGVAAAIGDDNTVYLPADKKIYALDAKTGAKKWEIFIGTDCFLPTIGSDGTLYIGGVSGGVMAIKTQSTGPSNGPWPMHGQNAQHTGRVMK